MANEIQLDCASGLTLYAVIRDRAGQVWHPTAQVCEDWGADDHTAADYAIGLTDKSGSHYVGDFDVNVAPGDYAIQVFIQGGATPADADDLMGSQAIVWTGVGELTAVKFLVNKAVQNKITDTFDYYDDDGQTVLLKLVRTEDATTCVRAPQG